MLWFDLMFDVQVLRHRDEPTLPEDVLASIATYYRRVTLDAFPMNRAVAAVMLVALAGSLYQLFTSPLRGAVGLALAGAAIGLAGGRVVPAAQRLARRLDSVEEQSAAARQICRDHLFCLGCIAAFVLVQLL